MNNKRFYLSGFLGLLGLVFSASIWAHGGAKGTDTDQCKIEIQGEWVHYTAYQPFKAPGEEFCAYLPDINTPTNFVFDYIGTKLRKMQVEYEITKEPEGTRVFHKPAASYQTGSVNATTTLTEPGEYLIHVTLIPEQGDQVDAHIGFTAGGGKQVTSGSLWLYALFAFAGLYILYFSSAGFKEQVDKLLGRAKKW